MTVDWPLIGDTPTLDGLAPKTHAAVTAATIDYLSRWSGGIYGLSEITVRPVRTRSGTWAGAACFRCDQTCLCEIPAALWFPWRVHAVEAVTVDGAPFDQWRLGGHRVLYRTDGEGWPTSQYLHREPGEPGTFTITLTKGVPGPGGGQIAAAELAEEIAKAISGDASCRLPARVQTITRQGVTVGMFDSMDDLDGGKTGLWLVDSWLASVNEAPRVGGVWSPDYDPGKVRYQ